MAHDKQHNLNDTGNHSGSLDDTQLSANVTLKGNSFNGASQLVELDTEAKLPAVDGSQLTNLPPQIEGVKSTAVLWVSKDGNDSTGDGASYAPFLTIQKAIDTVHTHGDNNLKHYCIMVMAGEYTEDLLLNYSDLRYLSIKSLGYHEVSLIGDITCNANNDSFATFFIEGLIQTGDLTLEGASEGTTFGNGDALFNNYQQGGGALVLKNMGSFSFKACKLVPTLATIENVGTGAFQSEEGIGGGIDVSITYNAANKKPAGITNCYVIFADTVALINASISAGAVMQLRKCRFGHETMTITNNGQLLAYESYIRSAITNNGVFNCEGSDYAASLYTGTYPCSGIATAE